MARLLPQPRRQTRRSPSGPWWSGLDETVMKRVVKAGVIACLLIGLMRANVNAGQQASDTTHPTPEDNEELAKKLTE